MKATPNELPVLRDTLKTHSTKLTPQLWTVLESAKPSDTSLLPSAGALASYAPEDGKWETIGDKVAQALVSVDAILLGPWIEALRPVRTKLTAPLATIFRDKERPESEHKLATNILADYASDDPDRLAELLMVADPKAYVSLFPVAEKRAEQVLPVLQAELAKKATYSWNDRAARSIVDEARCFPREPDRVGPGDPRRAVRFLPDDAAGRVSHDRRGSPHIGIPPRAVSPLCRRHGHPRRGRLDP